MKTNLMKAIISWRCIIEMNPINMGLKNLGVCVTERADRTGQLAHLVRYRKKDL